MLKRTNLITVLFILLAGALVSVQAQTLEEKALAKIDSLQSLIDSAGNIGISAEHEQMTLRIAEVFLGFADWDEANTSVIQTYFSNHGAFKDNAATLAADLPEFERGQVNEILDRAISRLNLCIDSSFTRKDFPGIDWAKAALSGNTIEQDGRPVFLQDHTWKPETNSLQEFFGGLDGFYISPSHVANAAGEIKSWQLTQLNSKPDGNIGSIFIDHTNIPSWAKSKWDSLEYSARLFTKYDIDHPGARELYELLFKGMIPKMAGKNYTKLGYMMANEPSFFTQADVWNNGPVSHHTKKKFRQWLAEKHDSITSLNSLWGTSYESFDSVRITIPISATHEGKPMWYDWMSFNHDRVTDYFRFLKNGIRKYDPEARVHIKVMPWCWTEEKKDHGIDFEALTRLSDISGSDAAAKYMKWWGSPDSWGEWTKRYAFEWHEISMTYDFFRSVKPNQIIFDTENHYLSSTGFTDLHMPADYPRAVYWLAYTHGLNAGRSWYWGRKESGEPDPRGTTWFAGSYTMQPRVLNSMHETVIDLNTYSEEITSIQQQPRPLRVYFSLTNSINRNTYMEDVLHNYEAIYYEGVPVGFATDSIIIESEAGDFEAIQVWKTESVTLREFNTLQAYLDSGGIVIMDETSFKTDEYGRPHPALDAGIGTIHIVSTLTELKNKAVELLTEKDLLPELVVTETNGVGPKGCMWRNVKNEAGNNVISMINLGKTHATITIDLPGAEFGTACRDLINGVSVSPDTLLPPKGILFLEVTEAEEVIIDTTDTTSNVAVLGHDDFGARLYPNPSAGSFSLELDNTYEQVDLEVINLSGRTVSYEQYYDTKRISRNLNGHPDGIYIFRLRSDQRVQTIRFIKQHRN